MPSGSLTPRTTSAARCWSSGCCTAGSPGRRPPTSPASVGPPSSGTSPPYRDGGLDGLRRWDVTGPVSDMAAYRDAIRESLTEPPVRTVAEACERIDQLTGLRRGPTQVRKFLKGLGLKWQRVRAIPVPPKKTWPSTSATSGEFLDTELKPRLDAAAAGQGHVFFVDAAHFVFGTFLCCLWSFARIFVRAASGRQRFNVLGAWNAVTRRTDRRDQHHGGQHRDDVRTVAEDRRRGLIGPITLVLDNARYQRNAVVQGVGGGVGDHAVVPAVVLAEPEPDRTAVEVHQAAGALRPLPSDVRRLSSRHRGDPRRHSDHPRRQAGLADDAQLPGI